MNSAAPIERMTLHEEVTHRLRDMIVQGQLAPGERIQEMALAQQLKVSRTPIRDALKVLTAEGLVQLLPLRGAVVRQFSAKDARDMLEVIALLEEYAGHQACLASEERIESVLALHQDMVRLYALRDRRAYFERNQQIHHALIALADNDSLRLTHDMMSKRMRSLRYSGNSSPENWAAAVQDHEAMAQALRQRDGQALSRAMGEHIRKTWDRIAPLLSPGPGTPSDAAM
jgi:DNA-binding GntR family transcriptional regulator